MRRHTHDQNSTRYLHTGKSVSPRRGSARAKASLTVEAALCLPLFFLAAILIMMILDIHAAGLAIGNGAMAAARSSAARQYRSPSNDPAALRADLVSAVGADRLDRSLVRGGSGGISTAKSTMDPVTGIGTLRWEYRISLPFPVFNTPIGRCEGRIRYKAWNGWHGGADDREKEEMVYVAENGVVYHRNPSCTHLALSITSVDIHNISTCRNESGGKYHACEFCGRFANSDGTVYIARDGDCYHSRRDCSGLKRTVEKIPISQVGGRRPCSRCS